jgi:hypothetical protein
MNEHELHPRVSPLCSLVARLVGEEDREGGQVVADVRARVRGTLC